VFGFEPGADHNLADYDQLLDFYRQLASASDRVRLAEIGTTTRGRPMVALFISDSENLEQLSRWQEIAGRLARARDLSDEEARSLAREGKAIVWIDSGLHSTEVAHAQHAPLLAYHMASDESGETRRIREEVILLLMPVMNPDGHEIVVDWYRDNLGTPFETTTPPEVYHEYVGHDNNRDWFMITQEETKHVARLLYEEWYPQIVFNHHQTGPTGTELFAPELYYLTQMPAEMHANDVLAVVVMALGLSFLATLYPSWRAARLDPVEALRYE
jgi:murein tripeptide amidase MpaA